MRGFALLACLCLGACASRPGHFYQDDGPPERIPPGLAQTPDAVPRIEPLNPHANRPYAALGRSYTPDTGDAPFEQRGMASWYGRQYHGNATASGEPYDMFAMTAAHPTLPIPSYARVTRVGDGRSVIVRINDRGPFLQDRVIDLSYAAAARLGIVGPGSAEVTVEKITAREIAAGNIARPAIAKAAAPADAPAAPQPAAASAAPREITAEPPSAEPAPAALSTPLAISTRVVASAQSPQELPLPRPPTAPGPGDSASQPPAVPPAQPVAPMVPAPQAPAPRPPDAPGAALPPAPEAPVMAAPPTIASPTARPAAEPPADPPKADRAVAAQPPPAPAPAASGRAAAPAVKAAAAGTPAAPTEGPWSIQLGAFALAEHAQALASTVGALLEGPGAEALPAANRAVRIEFDGRLHRVLVGGYAGRSSAQSGAHQLQEFLGRDTTVYRH